MSLAGAEGVAAAPIYAEIATPTAGLIGARLDRLPATRHVWMLVTLLSLGGFFEFYDLFLTGYVAPGLARDGILSPTTSGLFGTTGIASFIAATFAGLFIGTIGFGFIADRYGRRPIFTGSLLWYTACTVIMAGQTSAFGLNLWRFLAGIGIGVELVTIDTYISELVPRSLRGRAFAWNQMVQFLAIPAVAFLAYQLVPERPLGLSGWRWVVLTGAAAAAGVWWIRRLVPESPRWLASQGRLEEADEITRALEARVEFEHGPLPPPPPPEPQGPRGAFTEIFHPPYRRRTLMLVVFNLFQTVGFYGFANWVPTLLIAQGVTITRSLAYTFVIALAAPLGPLLAASIADRIERKWMIVGAAGTVAVTGLLFAASRSTVPLIALGVLLTLASNIMSFSFHAYQTELYPTRVRAMAVGFVYSFSRLSAVFTGFVIAFFLRVSGTGGVFVLIAGSMVVVMTVIAALGPPTRALSLEAISQ